MSAYNLRNGGFAFAAAKGLAMDKIDAGYLYELGSTIRSMRGLKVEQNDHNWQAWSLCINVRDAVQTFIEYSIYAPGLRSARTYGQRFVVELNALITRIEEHQPAAPPLTSYESMNVMRAFNAFEPVMIAELQSLPIFFVPPRGAFDNAYLIEAGQTLFPEILGVKVPEAIPDAQQAGKCIAFNLPTAAGFHLHRANEAVLRHYFDAVMGAGKRPRVQTMGTLLGAMKKASCGNPNVIAALDALKEFHRNPLMHPEHTFSDIDEAISLYCAIRAAISYMLEEIADPRVVDGKLRVLIGESTATSPEQEAE